jgi:hypothetical protein
MADIYSSVRLPSFYFTSRVAPFDWRLLHGVDVDEVVSKPDSSCYMLHPALLVFKQQSSDLCLYASCMSAIGAAERYCSPGGAHTNAAAGQHTCRTNAVAAQLCATVQAGAAGSGAPMANAGEPCQAVPCIHTCTHSSRQVRALMRFYAACCR